MLPVQTPLAIAIYFTMWWIVLLAVLPLGVRSQHENLEDDEPPPPGCDPGAPRAPMLGKKALITTAVTTTLWAALMVAIKVMGW
ncbi:MAG TPA: DUF1467 family protein [Methylocystis sp.]|nr:DUF1467 family protein [Methylocystis sp.]